MPMGTAKARLPSPLPPVTALLAANCAYHLPQQGLDPTPHTLAWQPGDMPWGSWRRKKSPQGLPTPHLSPSHSARTQSPGRAQHGSPPCQPHGAVPAGHQCVRLSGTHHRQRPVPRPHQHTALGHSHPSAAQGARPQSSGTVPAAVVWRKALAAHSLSPQTVRGRALQAQWLMATCLVGHCGHQSPCPAPPCVPHRLPHTSCKQPGGKEHPELGQHQPIDSCCRIGHQPHLAPAAGPGSGSTGMGCPVPQGCCAPAQMLLHQGPAGWVSTPCAPVSAFLIL